MATSSPTSVRAAPKHETPPAVKSADAQTSPPTETARQSAPSIAFRAGSVSAAIFANTVKVSDRDVTMLSISLRRSYRDAQGSWATTHSLRVRDLPLAIFALMKCYEHVLSLDDDEDEGQ